MRYYEYDENIWREPAPGELEIRLSGEWVPAIGDYCPSEQDFDHMRQISEQDARRLLAQEAS